MILETTDATFATDIQSDLPVVVDFWAPWCGPCKALEPKLKQIAEDYAGKLKVIKLNIDESPATKEQFGIRGIPTLLFFVDGEQRNRLTGASILRVQVSIEKLLETRGVALSISQPSAVDESTPQVRVVRQAFSSDETVKAACLTRLREMTITEDAYPASVMAGGNGLFETVAGAPGMLAFLINMVWKLQADGARGLEVAHRQLLRMMEVIPVGSDVGLLHRVAMYWLMYDSHWEITSCFVRENELNLLAKIKVLHQQELRAEESTSSAWESLQREAVLLVDVSNPDDSINTRSQRIERLARPLDHSVGDVWRIADLATEDLQRYPEWSPEHRARWEALNLAINQRLKEEVGAPPQEPQAQVEWLPRAKEVDANLRRQYREEHGEIFERHDAWMTYCREIKRTLGYAVIEFMIDRLQSDASDSVI
jgi:thioredoxin